VEPVYGVTSVGEVEEIRDVIMRLTSQVFYPYRLSKSERQGISYENVMGKMTQSVLSVNSEDI